MDKKRKICVITGSRAEYGLLYLTMRRIQESKDLDLQIIATGTHLSSSFGNTIKEIESDGFKVNHRINILDNDDSSAGIAKSMSRVMERLPKYLKKMKPDLILMLGDRFEIFASAATATVLNIPIAHICGGETTEGAFDESFRHSITKMSHLHFVSTETYKNRVIQLGESPSRVFNVGSPGVERIKKLRLIPKEKVEDYIGIKFNKTNFLITIHPETLNRKKINQQILIALGALKKLKDTTFIFTMPNNDIGSYEIEKQIKKFCKNNNNAFFFKSLGRTVYLSCVKRVDAVLGNSSSGIIEVPSLKKPSIDIGKRQYGRVRARSVISCDFNKLKILNSIKKIYSKKFLMNVNNFTNPYYKKYSSKIILQIIERIKLNKISCKKF